MRKPYLLLAFLALLLLAAPAHADQHVFPALITEVSGDDALTVLPLTGTDDVLISITQKTVNDLPTLAPGLLVDITCAGFEGAIPALVEATILRPARFEGTVEAYNVSQSVVSVRGPWYDLQQVRLPAGTDVAFLSGRQVVYYPTAIDGEDFRQTVAADEIEIVRSILGTIASLSVDHLMLETEDGHAIRVNLSRTTIPYTLSEGSTVDVLYQSSGMTDDMPTITALTVWIING